MNILYAKSVLYAYPNLEAIALQIDELVEKKALGSMTDFSPALEQYQSIINLTEQKTVLFELEILTEKILKKFTEEENDLLDYKYFRKKKKEDFANFDTSSRAYFRKQIKVAEKFAEQLERAGFNDKAFEERCLEIEFFKQLYKRVIEHEIVCNKNKSKTSKPCPRTLQGTSLKISA